MALGAIRSVAARKIAKRISGWGVCPLTHSRIVVEVLNADLVTYVYVVLGPLACVLLCCGLRIKGL